MILKKFSNKLLMQWLSHDLEVVESLDLNMQMFVDDCIWDKYKQSEYVYSHIIRQWMDAVHFDHPFDSTNKCPNIHKPYHYNYTKARSYILV